MVSNGVSKYSAGLMNSQSTKISYQQHNFNFTHYSIEFE